MPPEPDGNTFALQLDGVTVAVFERLTVLGYQIDVVETREVTADGRTVVRKVPGTTKWGPLVLARRADGNATLEQWRALVLEGRGDEARRHGTLVQLDAQSTEVARWQFRNGWPSGWSLSSADGAVIETVTIQHDGLSSG